DIKNYKDKRGRQKSYPRNLSYQFLEGLTWSDITSKMISVRYTNKFMFSDVGNTIFIEKDKLYNLLGFVNSTVMLHFSKFITSTYHFKPGNMLNTPYKEVNNPNVEPIVKQNISLSKFDWDAFET